MPVFLKIHSFPEGNVIALCDKDILGKRFEEKELVLDIDKDFYEGEEASKEDVFKALGECVSATIAGNEAVALALECNAVSEGGVKEVCGIKCALMFRI